LCRYVEDTPRLSDSSSRHRQSQRDEALLSEQILRAVGLYKLNPFDP
jgi:hypothetical protein